MKTAGFLGTLLLLLISIPVSGAVQQAVAPAEGQILHLQVNKSVVINLPSPITRVLSSNPNAIEIVATAANQLVVSGKGPGSSSLIIWDSPANQQMLDVIVEPDITALRAAVSRAYPREQILVDTDGVRLLLSGPVSSQKIVEDLLKMAALYSPQVVNLMTVGEVHDRQMILEVKFAEVDRTKITQFGINIFNTGAFNTPGAISTQQFGPPTLGGPVGQNANGTTSNTFNLSDILNVFMFNPDINVAVTLKDLEQRALLQILAEPNLMALNGQQATFLAGGEFPFPIVQSGQSAGAVTVQFRPFGVRLDFKGTIGADSVIRLHVAPEVSTLDFANSISISGFVVPAISTRRAETEIELKDGQSFGIAGLLDHRAQSQMNKIPGLGDIPILGQFFPFFDDEPEQYGTDRDCDAAHHRPVEERDAGAAATEQPDAVSGYAVV